MKYVTLIPINFINKALQINDVFSLKNEDAIKELLVEGEVRPVRDVMTEEYRELTSWLHQHNLSRDEIKETLPGLYSDIQTAIDMLDHAFVGEDMQAFHDALDRVRSLYAEALIRCGRRIAYKVYSEILQGYLWVVDTDADMHLLRSKGISEAVYTKNEIRKLTGMDKDSLRAIHKVKETFENSKAEEVKTKRQES
jgi:hypothetical protein